MTHKELNTLLDTAIDKLLAARTTHNDIAKENIGQQSVFTARLTASIVLGSLIEALLAVRLANRIPTKELSNVK